jgi:hypothetical protein
MIEFLRRESSGHSIGHEDKRDGLQTMRIIVAASLLLYGKFVFVSISRVALRYITKRHEAIMSFIEQWS